MNTIKQWLELAKKNHLQVTNISDSDELSLCINLLEIVDSNVVAVTVTVMKDGRKANALPPWAFAKVMFTIENLMKNLNCNDSELCKPVTLDTKWYQVLKCHRIFFIPETLVANFIALFLSVNYLNQIKSQELSNVYILAKTTQFYFNSKF